MTDKELEEAIINSQKDQTLKYKAYCESVRNTDKLKMMKRVRRIDKALSEGKAVTILYHNIPRTVKAVSIPENITTPSGEISNLINVTYVDKDGNDKIVKIDYHGVDID